MKYYAFLTMVIAVMVLLGACALRSSTGTLVEYRRTGGFAGLDDHLIIRTNGQVTVTRKGERYEFLLTRDEMTKLQNAFSEAGFSKLRGEYLPSREGSDLFEYVLTYKGHTVRTKDTAIPNDLQPILESLNYIMESHSKP